MAVRNPRDQSDGAPGGLPKPMSPTAGGGAGGTLEEERAARRAAEGAEQRMAFLARASAELASSLDYQTTLRTVARLAVPDIADWCAIDLLENGELLRLAVEHVDPAKVQFVSRIQERYPPDPDSSRGAYEVARTGRSQVIEEIPESFLVEVAVDEEHLHMLSQLGLRSYVAAPLVARGQILGVITLVQAESGRTYGSDALLLVEDLARRAGTAIDNARLVTELEQARASLEEQASELEIQAEELETQNEELETQAQELMVALQTRSDFMATVSHELRTPLNAIMGYSQLLEMGLASPLPDAALGYVRRIGLSAHHLLQLIDDILTFSSIEANRQTAELDDLDIADLLEEVGAIIEPIAEADGLTFAARTVDAPSTFRTDPRKLRQVLLNLLGNAVKFTDEGGIELVVRSDGPDLLFEVHDTGMGIPADEHDRLFEPYWQGAEARSLSIGGAGLGLTISRRFAHILGGDLEAVSTPGKGSVFTVRLPLEPPTA